MKIDLIVAVLITPFLLISCESQPIDGKEEPVAIHAYTDAYQPPVFINDARASRIEGIADEIQQLIAQHSIDRKVPGIAYGVVVDNTLIVSGAVGVINLDNEQPATPTSVFRIASMTKSFTAMAIMKLRDEGKLSLADPAAKYIPEMGNLTYLTADAPIINIENLLTMTAGFPEDNPWGDRQLDETDQMLIDLVNEGISFSNASSFQYEYSNTGFALLGNIISRVSGMPYQDYIQKNILIPLGMDHTYWEYANIPPNQLVLGYRWEDDQWKPEPLLHDGSYGAMGGLMTTIEDFSKYVSYHLSAWPPRNDDEAGPVKRSTLREMHTPTYPRLYIDATALNGDPCAAMVAYGYGLRISKDCDGYVEVAHGGALPGFGSNYVFFPEYGVGLMAFGNRTYTSPWPLRKIKQLLFETLDIQPRQLPVSDILAIRQTQVANMIQNWDTELEAEIVAENFYMDKSRDHRMAQIKEELAKAGAIQNIDVIEPYNQLRGQFEMQGEHGIVSVFFTLSPEPEPKLQQLNVRFKPMDKE